MDGPRLRRVDEPQLRGFPIGSAIAGVLAATSIDAAVIFGIVAAVAGTLIAAAWIPFGPEAADAGHVCAGSAAGARASAED